MASACWDSARQHQCRAYLPRRKNVDRHHGWPAGSARAQRDGHRPGGKLLAVGHYLESTVDIAESTRRIAASRIPADHMILMAGFYRRE